MSEASDWERAEEYAAVLDAAGRGRRRWLATCNAGQPRLARVTVIDGEACFTLFPLSMMAPRVAELRASACADTLGEPERTKEAVDEARKRAARCAAALDIADYRGLRWEAGDVRGQPAVVGRDEQGGDACASLPLEEAEKEARLLVEDKARREAALLATIKARLDEPPAPPDHYTWSDMPPIDVIESWGMGPEFCLGNVIKYLGRWRHKDGIRDLRKAQDYIGMAIGMLEREAAR